jgi:hypothetical protein
MEFGLGASKAERGSHLVHPLGEVGALVQADSAASMVVC